MARGERCLLFDLSFGSASVAYHPSVQQVASVDTETGETCERRLNHNGEAERFYRDLEQRRVRVRVGIEATGHARSLTDFTDRC
jgi:hypothetical protein